MTQIRSLAACLPCRILDQVERQASFRLPLNKTPVCDEHYRAYVNEGRDMRPGMLGGERQYGRARTLRESMAQDEQFGSEGGGSLGSPGPAG